MKKIEILKGTTAFLNGQQGLHDQEEKFCKVLQQHKKKVLILDNLFEEKDKLKKITKCNNIVLSTRGTYKEHLDPLVLLFEKLNYAPKVVIFGGEGTALYFAEHARELNDKYGTKFYYFDTMDKTILWEIGWL